VIKQLRKFWNEQELAEIYAKPHDHTKWGHGHHLRIEFSINLGRWAKQNYRCNSLGDLSCGNAAAAHGIACNNLFLGDFAPGYQFTGPIEQTIYQMPNVDLFVNLETLEHLEEPGEVLKLIRAKSRTLLLSTPIEAWEDGTPEHYWAWDTEGVESLMTEAGWKPTMYATLDSGYIGEAYKYGFWVAT